MAVRVKHYTVMFIPENTGKSFSFRIPKVLVNTAAVIIIMLAAVLSVLIYKSGEIAARLQLVYTLRAENHKLAEENKHLRSITKKIAHIESLASYLENIAVLPGTDKQINQVPQATQSTARDVSSSDSIGLSTQEKQTAVPSILPVQGWLTRGFDPVNGHMGNDYAATMGTLIKASASGIVQSIQNDSYYGLNVIIKHDQGFTTRYCHCSQILVATKDRVNRGQTIALVGNTGKSSAPHLHYEIFKDGKAVDPQKYILKTQ